jgi:hypothetical protein
MDLLLSEFMRLLVGGGCELCIKRLDEGKSTSVSFLSPKKAFDSRLVIYLYRLYFAFKLYNLSKINKSIGIKLLLNFSLFLMNHHCHRRYRNLHCHHGDTSNSELSRIPQTHCLHSFSLNSTP